jgi:putative hydrolase of HD superfamily
VNEERIANRLLDFQKLLLQFLDIERLIYLPDAKKVDRLETDTEHSFHLAMLAWYACGAFPKLDRDKVIRYAIAHDIVEIHAGDVMAVGRTEEEQLAKQEREVAALARLKVDWPDFKDLTDTIEAYENQTDPEAVFVKALDKLTPMLLQILSEGKTWKKYDLARSTIFELKDRTTANSPEVTKIWQEFKRTIEAHDEWFSEGRAD